MHQTGPERPPSSSAADAPCPDCTPAGLPRESGRAGRQLTAQIPQPPSPPLPPSSPFPPFPPTPAQNATPVLVGKTELPPPAFGTVHLSLQLEFAPTDNITYAPMPDRTMNVVLYDTKASKTSLGYIMCNFTAPYAHHISTVCKNMPPASVQVVVFDAADPSVKLFDGLRVGCRPSARRRQPTALRGTQGPAGSGSGRTLAPPCCRQALQHALAEPPAAARMTGAMPDEA